MASDKKITVIIPVYNTEKELPIVVESVISQTMEDWELILVNDGSTDCSGKICLDYAKKDPRIIAINKENGGVSSARNIGIENASAPYLCFVDSDDYIAPDYFETLLNNIEDYDLLVFGYTKTTLENLSAINIQSHNRRAYNSLILKHKDDFKNNIVLILNNSFGLVCNKLYKTDIIKREKLHYEDIQSEDELFSYTYLLHTASLKMIDYNGYYYIERTGSMQSHHKNITESNWINKIIAIHEELIKRYSIEDKRYFEFIRQQLSFRHKMYLAKGYFKDTHVNRRERLERWQYANLFYKKISTKNLPFPEKAIALIAKSWLRNLADICIDTIAKISKK